jgi:CelD/BcsL family acetyltransferase involved in cellulose biosynthesis
MDQPVTRQRLNAPSGDGETKPLLTRCVTNWDDAGDLAGEWSALLQRVGWSSVFQTWEWHRCWWDAFGSSDKLRLILCYRDRQLVAAAPMMLSKAHPRLGRARNQLCFVGSPNNASDYCDVLVDPDVPGALHAVLEEVVKHSEAADCLHLTNMPSHSPNFSGIVRFLQNRRSPLIIETDQLAPTRILGHAEEDRKVASKSSLRRRFNYFDKAGDLKFRRCTSAMEILNYLDVFFEQHKARRKLAGSVSQFHDASERDFYRALVSTMVAPGWLKFDVVTFDGNPLAVHLGFEYRDSFIWYKPTFDVAFASRSPGEVLIKYLLQDAIDKRLKEFDFTVGDEPFKFRFSNKTRVNMRVIGFQSEVQHKLYELKKYLYALRAKLKSRFSDSIAEPV